MKVSRHAKIVELINQYNIETQEELAEQLNKVSGMAMAVAASIDSMQWYEVVGCIAGDDTIMCAVRSTEETKIVMEKIRKIVL